MNYDRMDTHNWLLISELCGRRRNRIKINEFVLGWFRKHVISQLVYVVGHIPLTRYIGMYCEL